MKQPNRSISILIYFVCIACFHPISHAQDVVIPLWTDAISGAIPATNYFEKPVFKENRLESTSQVVTPTLSVYFPEKKKPNGTAVLIFPGGGYHHLALYKEGEKVAQWLNSLGITAFVLKYRLPNDLIMKDKSLAPLQDAQAALRKIRSEAQKWGIDPNKIGVLGFSAGGHLAASLCTRFDEILFEADPICSARPDFAVLIYPVISMEDGLTHGGSRLNLLGPNPTKATIEKFSNEKQVSTTTPPTFIVHASDDTAVLVENSLNYYLALKAHSIPVEMHLYPKGGHGFGLGLKDTSLYWTESCQRWLENVTN